MVDRKAHTPGKVKSLKELDELPLIFIVGRGRSGSTLLRSMLDAHPAIMIPLESRFVQFLYYNFPAKGPWSANTAQQALDVLESGFEPLELDREAFLEHIKTFSGDLNFDRVSKLIYLHTRSGFKKEEIRILGDKNPRYTFFIPQLLRLFPGAKFIHLVRDYRDNIDIDASLLEDMRERTGAIYLLKKKYGGTLDNVLSHKDKIVKELSIAENFSQNIDELEKKAEIIKKRILKLGLDLSNKRKKEAKSVEKLIQEALSYLGITDSNFQIKFEYEENSVSDLYVNHNGKDINLIHNGLDLVEFYITTNKGEDLKPLAKTASGGEISRIMLAIKSVMAKTEKLPLLVFDEIDVGISGRIAQKVGKVLKDLSSSHQIISITHLPQIAAFADHHYSVSKASRADRIISLINKLNEEEKVTEVAKLLSGEKVTESNITTAKELINSVVS
jgi:ABC-type uncharacterized transport system ATPase subunit